MLLTYQPCQQTRDPACDDREAPETLGKLDSLERQALHSRCISGTNTIVCMRLRLYKASGAGAISGM